MMTKDLAVYDQEELQSILFQLKLSQHNEQKLAEENRAILNAIAEMSEADNRNQIFAGLERVLRKYIRFEDFIVISRLHGEKQYRTLSSSNSHYLDISWPDKDKFSRAIKGECITLFRPREAEELHDALDKKSFGSCVFTGISGEVTQSILMLICQHNGCFSIETQQTLKRFLPLIERAVIDIENKEKLQRIVDARTIELAEARTEAEKATKAKTEFLAMMSHELRTPLNSIIGMLDVLKDSQLPVEQGAALNHMECSASLLLTIISDILDLSRIESGNFSINKQWSSLGDTVTSAIVHLKPLADEKSITLSVMTDIDNELQYFIDTTRISQIIFNLVGNAIKFTHKGSVEVAVFATENNLNIQVEDTGIGIPVNKQGLLFEAFRQADTTITRKFGGTGLGLTITKHLIELMNGTIQFQSKINVGTRFDIQIPIECQCSRKAPDIDKKKQGDPLSILIVEDTKSNQFVISLLLKNMGHRVSIANHGLEAIEMVEVQEKPFDLIFMDISMPVMDGLSATRKLREMGCKQPIIALTAHGSASDKQQCESSGMSGFLTKPVRQIELLESIELAFDQMI